MTRPKTPAQLPFSVRFKTVQVVSATDPNLSYDVQLPHCTCPDFRWRDLKNPDAGAHLCKHIRFAMGQLAGWQALEQDEEGPGDPVVMVA